MPLHASSSSRGRWLSPSWASACAASVLCALATLAHGATPEPDTQEVEVHGHRDTSSKDERGYRGLLKAMEMFEAYQRQHPDARLRFRVAQRREAGELPPLKLRVVSDSASLPITLDADLGFLPPVSKEMRDADAVVRSNWPSGALAWWVEVTREGGDPQRRLLGDLRQECTLDLYGAELMRGIKSPTIYALKAAHALCESPSLYWGVYAERPVFSVGLQHGERRASLTSDELHGGPTPAIYHPLLDWPYLLRDRTYLVRTGNTAWPDVTVVSIAYAEEAQP